KTAGDFLAAMDGGRYADAYGLFLADFNRRYQSLAQFSDRIGKFNAKAGAVKERRIVKVTWTKNPAQAPAPGVYAAIDLISRFANIDRHCGYIVLYQPPAGGDFRVTRQEDNYLDNATAESIAKDRSQADVDKA